MHRKAKKAALQSAILSRLIDSEVVLVDRLEFVSPSTKKMADILKRLEIKEGCLVVIKEFSEMVWKSCRNIYNVKLRIASDLNAYDVVRFNKILMVRDVLDGLKLGKSN
jgi:large subunit ribosomal protein L4